MQPFHTLAPRHRQLLHSVATRLLEKSKAVSSLDMASFIYAGSWSHGDGERLHTAFRNRSAHGHAHYSMGAGRGRKAEHRLQAMRWAVWSPIIKKAEEDLIRDGDLTRVNPDAPWHPCPESMQNYFYEILPPAFFIGGFACPEAQCHTSKGRPVLLCFRRFSGQWFCRYATLLIAEFTVPAAA